MDLVILSGGLGKRLGALTQKRHKGALEFSGQPMLVRLLDQWLTINSITTIWVVTGYRKDDIEDLLRQTYPNLLANSKIRIVQGSSDEIGTLRRFACALRDGAGKETGCIVIGIDVLLAMRDVRRFVSCVRKTKHQAILAVSRDMSKASTHPAVRTKVAEIVEYLTGSQQKARTLKGAWLRDTGVRYFSGGACAQMLEAAARHAYIGGFLASADASAVSAAVYVLTRPWVHIAISSDFTSRVPK
jgi:NDP-sugar pyrophosphorylase family protein